jgi:hypothetical protein
MRAKGKQLSSKERETEDNTINLYNHTTNLFNHNNKETERMQAKDNNINLK